MPIQEVVVCEKSVRKCTPNTEKPVSHENTHIDIESATICYLILPESHTFLDSRACKCKAVHSEYVIFTFCKMCIHKYLEYYNM